MKSRFGISGAQSFPELARIGIDHWAAVMSGWLYWYFWVVVAAIITFIVIGAPTADRREPHPARRFHACRTLCVQGQSPFVSLLDAIRGPAGGTIMNAIVLVAVPHVTSRAGYPR